MKKRNIRLLEMRLRVWLALLVALVITGCGSTAAPNVASPTSDTSEGLAVVSATAAPVTPGTSAPATTQEPTAAHSDASSAATGAIAPTERASLTLAFPDEPATVAATTKLIEAYTAENAAVQITARLLPSKEYLQQLLSQSDSNAPDLFVSSDAQLPALIHKQALLDLEPLLSKSTNLNPNDFQASALAPWQRGSALYGLPTDVSPQVLFYNQDVFDAAGVSYPTSEWTWEDWLDAAKKLTNTSNNQVRYGTALSEWSFMIWGNGGELLNADNTQTLLDQPAATEGVQFFADMINVHKVAPLPQAAGGPNPIELFKQQEVAMLPATSSAANEFLQAKLPFKWGITSLPTGKNTVSRLSVSGLAISAKSQNQQAALDFATWAIGSEGQQIRTQLIPFAASALRTAPARSSQIDGTDAILDALKHGRTLPQTEQWPKIAGLVNESLKPVWKGEETASAAYSKVTPEINKLLAAG